MSHADTRLVNQPLPKASDIELVIFDLGGVILDIDYRLTQSAFANLGVQNVEQLYSKAAQGGLFDKMERGQISPDEFRNGIRAWLSHEVSDEQIDEAWNALIMQIPPARLEAIAKLRQSIRTCLLSNTNAIHISCFTQVIAAQGLSDVYQSAFEQIYYSSEIGQRKPDAAAFEHVLQGMRVAPEKALFIDDSEQHILSARSLGMHAYHLQVGAEDVCEILSRLSDSLA